MTKSGQTYGYKASDHLNVVESYTGRVDSVVLHVGEFPANALEVYKSIMNFRSKMIWVVIFESYEETL